MPDHDSPETDALLAGADVELTADDPPGGDGDLSPTDADSERSEKDDAPLTTDDAAQEQDSVVQPDNS